MSAQIYFLINALLYIVFTIWCFVKPTATAAFSGLSFLNNSGKAEYIAVYGGMEAGFAAFYVICALKNEMHYAGIIFSICFYAGIIIGRWYAIIHYGTVSKNAYTIATLEILLGIWAVILLAQYKK